MKRCFTLALLLALLTLPLGCATARTPFPEFTALVERNAPAVVSIDVGPARGLRGGMDPGSPFPLPEDDDNPFYDYFRRFFDETPQRQPRRPRLARGSGFVISADGYIVTNAHVVEDAGRILVGLWDRRRLEATVVGTDPRSDVALLKVAAEDLTPVDIGDPTRLKVGQWVLAIGSPFGLEATATQGIISALGRSLPQDSYMSFIQTDAAINPGNSGGPLFNLDGQVIGVNSQIYSRTGGYMGVSFAIPIDLAMEVVSQLRDTGQVARGWLGVMIQSVSFELAESFGLDRPRGALVGQVFDGSPADKGGLRAGDIIVAFGGKAVDRSSDLPLLVGRTPPDTRTPVTVIRDGNRQTLTVRIEPLENQPERLLGQAPPPSSLGLTVRPLSPAEQERIDGEGVRVESVAPGPAQQAGIQPGDILTHINRQPIEDPDTLARLARALPRGEPVAVRLVRRDEAQFLALTLPD